MNLAPFGTKNKVYGLGVARVGPFARLTLTALQAMSAVHLRSSAREVCLRNDQNFECVPPTNL
jgi:hypothetical protein